MTDTSATRLVALDADDLAVISAQMQDAIMRVGDVRWLRGPAKLALVANRYDHLSDAARGAGERRQTGLQISRVSRVAAANIVMDDPSAILSLLAIGFEPGKVSPEGAIVLTFAGGGAIRAEVECIEVAMADLGPKWTARARPSHELDDSSNSSGGSGSS